MPYSKQLILISFAMILAFLLSEPVFADSEPNWDDYELVISDAHQDIFFFNYKENLNDSFFMYEGVWYSHVDQKIFNASFIFRKSNQSMCLTAYHRDDMIFYYNMATKYAYGKRLNGAWGWLNSGNDPNSINSMNMVIEKGDIKGMTLESGK